ncbi:unnamed protein product [Chrysoparadoxa australica]
MQEKRRRKEEERERQELLKEEEERKRRAKAEMRRQERKKLEAEKKALRAEQRKKAVAKKQGIDLAKKERIGKGQHSEDAKVLISALITPDAESPMTQEIEPSGSRVIGVRLSLARAEQLKQTAGQVQELLRKHQEELELLRKDQEGIQATKRRLTRDKGDKMYNKDGSIKYPIDDALLLELDDLDVQLPERPPPIKKLTLDPKLVGRVLKVWDFLHAFQDVLSLSPCTLDDFIDALQYPTGGCALMTEVHCRLLMLVTRDSRGSKMWEEAVTSPGQEAPALEAGTRRRLDMHSPSGMRQRWAAERIAQADTLKSSVGIELLPPHDPHLPGTLLTSFTWQPVLRQLLPVMRSFQRVAFSGAEADVERRDRYRSLLELLDTVEHFAFPVESKVSLLEILVDMAYETKRVRNTLHENMDSRLALEHQRRDELQKLTRTEKQEEKSCRDQVVKALKQRLQKEWEDAKALKEKAEAARAKEKAKAEKAAAKEAAKEEGKKEEGKKGARKKKKKLKDGEEQPAAEGSTPTSATATAAATETKKAPSKKKDKPKEPHYHDIQRGMAALKEEIACGGEPFVLKPLEEIMAASPVEEDEAEEEEPHLELLSRAEMMRLRREKEKRAKEKAKKVALYKKQAGLRSDRVAAVSALEAALAKQDLPSLKAAVAKAQEAQLEGGGKEEGSGSTRWMCPQLKDAYVAVATLTPRWAKAEISSRFARQLGPLFVRNEPIGTDRDGRLFWVYQGDQRVFVEEQRRRPGLPPAKGRLNPVPITAQGEEPEPVYDPEDYAPEKYESSWLYYDMEELPNVIASLDDRGIRERALKMALEERIDVAKMETSTAQKEAPTHWLTAPNEALGLVKGSEHLGKSIRREFGKHGFSNGKVIGWMPAESNDGLALWHIKHEDGDEEDLEEHEVLEGIKLAEIMPSSEAEEKEGEDSKEAKAPRDSHDGTFLDYVNKLNKGPGFVKFDETCFDGLRAELLAREGAMLSAQREKMRQYARGGRALWIKSVKDATEQGHLKSALIELEAILRSLQEVDDVIEDAKMAMEHKGWRFDLEAHEWIGTRVRRFIKDTEGQTQMVDGKIIGYRPHKSSSKDKEIDEKKRGRWVMETDDGAFNDEELLAAEVEKAMGWLEQGVTEPPDDEEDEEDDDDGEEEGAEDMDEDEDEDSEESEEESEDESEEEVTTGGRGAKKGPRETLWPNWGKRQRWIKAVQEATTVGGLGMGFLSLVENAASFGCGIESIVEENRLRARKQNAWQSKRAADSVKALKDKKGKRKRGAASTGTSKRMRGS